MKTYNKIWKITTGQTESYTIVCLLYYNGLKEHYKMIAINLGKQ